MAEVSRSVMVILVVAILRLGRDSLPDTFELIGRECEVKKSNDVLCVMPQELGMAENLPLLDERSAWQRSARTRGAHSGVKTTHQSR